MNKWVLDGATFLLCFAYLIHSCNYFILGKIELSVAMILFAIAMIFLF